MDCKTCKILSGLYNQLLYSHGWAKKSEFFRKTNIHIIKNYAQKIKTITEPMLKPINWHNDSVAEKISALNDGIVFTKSNESALPFLFSDICENDGERKQAIVYSFGHYEVARKVKSGCNSAGFFSLANIESSITADARHARNLGYQLASEVFASMMAIESLDIFIVGADRIFISDRKGYSRRYTEEFWNAFVSSINCSRNQNRIFLYCGAENEEVTRYLLSLSTHIISADLVDDAMDIQITRK